MDTSQAAPNGIHHIAISTADMKAQLEFFTDVLGGRLTGLFWMHGVPGGRHAFVELSPTCYVSFVDLPGNHEVDAELGVTHAGTGAGVSAPGTTQHLALNAESLDDLLAIRDRIRSRGVNVMGYIDHGMCKSMYFAGPEGLVLEVATAGATMNPEAWIDPEVVEACGIGADDLARFKDPAPYDGPGNEPQPAVDPGKPHLAYPPEVYEIMMTMSDADVAEQASYTDPPVSV